MRDEKDQALARRFQDEAWTIGELIATVRGEERKATMRDAILLVDTAPLCHCASKQYIDPVALVQRMNAALEDASENTKGEG